MYGCGKIFNPNPFQPWIVTLRNDERIEVMAVNETHARNLVVFGGSFHVGAAIKVHPSNIKSAIRAQ
jgi:hypothetical protein